MKKILLGLATLVFMLVLTSSISLAADAPKDTFSKAVCSVDSGVAPTSCGLQENTLIASSGCGGNLACGFNTGCAPGRNACCPRSAPNLNMCNCRCYAHKNYNTSKGGCNVWHNCH